jgi:hypothetical protein
MGMMIIRHKVRDYGQWRPLFDGHAETQKAAGLSMRLTPSCIASLLVMTDER